jgi:ribosomal protein S18 acetylase RimI-like enzyme
MSVKTVLDRCCAVPVVIIFWALFLRSVTGFRATKSYPQKSQIKPLLNLFKLDNELPLREHMPPQSKDWNIYLLERKDLNAAAELAMNCFYTPRLKLNMDGMEGWEKWLWENIMRFYTEMDKSDSRNGNYLGFWSRSRKRLDVPSFELTTDSFILAATSATNGCPDELAAVVEICLETPNGQLAPPIQSPFRSIVPNPTEQPYLCNLCVADKHKRKGLGKMLCQLCEELVQIHWGKDVMYLHVEQRNSAAQALYKGLGYTIVTPGLSAWERKLHGMEGILYYSKPLRRRWIRPWKEQELEVQVQVPFDASMTSDNSWASSLDMSPLDMDVASDIMQANVA